MAGAEEVLRKALDDRSRAGQDAFLPGHGAEERTAATTRRSTHLRDGRRRSTRATASCCNQLGRVLFLKRQYRGRDRRAQEGAGDRPRGSAGALQPDAVLPGPRRRGQGRARADAVRALQGRRVVAGHHRARTGSSIPHDNNERQSIHEHRSAPTARRPATRVDRPACRAGRRETRRCAARGVAAVAGAVAGRALAARRRRAGRRSHVHRRHRGRRHPLPPQQRRVRQEVPAGDDGLRRARSSTSTATAGRTSCSSTRTSWPGRPGRARRCRALYRNNGNGTFTDITRASGLAVEMYGLGVAAADYDNDGDADVYITGARRQPAVPQPRRRPLRRRDRARRRRRRRLLDERRCGSTTTTTASSICSSRNYVEWSIEKDLFCTLDGKTKSYCTPESYKGQSPTLYRNRGDGTFEDVTRRPGLHDPDRQGARRRAARLRRRRLARSVRRQRHAAEPAVSQQAATARSPTSA